MLERLSRFEIGRSEVTSVSPAQFGTCEINASDRLAAPRDRQRPNDTAVPVAPFWPSLEGLEGRGDVGWSRNVKSTQNTT